MRDAGALRALSLTPRITLSQRQRQRVRKRPAAQLATAALHRPAPPSSLARVGVGKTFGVKALHGTTPVPDTGTGTGHVQYPWSSSVYHTVKYRIYRYRHRYRYRTCTYSMVYMSYLCKYREHLEHISQHAPADFQAALQFIGKRTRADRLETEERSAKREHTGRSLSVSPIAPCVSLKFLSCCTTRKLGRNVLLLLHSRRPMHWRRRLQAGIR